MTTTTTFDPLAIGEMPQINPAVGAASAAQPPPAPGPIPAREVHPYDGKRDRKGNLFDASRHIPKEHPTTGVWMPKKRSKTPLPESAPAPEFVPFTASPEFKASIEPPAPPAPERKRSPMLANGGELLAASWYQLNAIFHGPDAEPKSKQEHDLIRMSFQDCIDEYAAGLDDIPPWLGLSLVLANYEASRILAPKTQNAREKLADFASVMRSRIARGFRKLFGMKTGDEAPEVEAAAQ